MWALFFCTLGFIDIPPDIISPRITFKTAVSRCLDLVTPKPATTAIRFFEALNLTFKTALFQGLGINSATPETVVPKPFDVTIEQVLDVDITIMPTQRIYEHLKLDGNVLHVFELRPHDMVVLNFFEGNRVARYRLPLTMLNLVSHIGSISES